MTRSRAVRRLCALAAAALAASIAVAAPAAAAPVGNWARWGAIAGSTHEFSGSMQLPAGGFPAAEWTSDSRSTVQLPTGASTFLGPTTAPGVKYGTSRNNAYLNLRPYADNASSPSTTTFTFDSPTPDAGWAFVLGDIDADKVHIEAIDADGRAVSDAAVDRWERGAFNYASAGGDKPAWDATTATLTGNTGAVDTDGASDWFEPDVALSSLTFVFTQRSGFPVYQVWFASLAHDVTGTVTGTTQCAAAASTVRLLGPDGSELASKHPDADGSYSFAGYTAQDGYTVAVDPPPAPVDGCIVTAPAERAADLRTGDAAADFALRDVVPQAVGGTVTTSGGTAVPDATVTLTTPAGGPRTTTTDGQGNYLFDDNVAGAGYTVAVTPPDGFRAVPPDTHTFDITAGTPVPSQDFTVAALPAVSGTVIGPDGPVGGVTIVLHDSVGGARTAVTGADGSYTFDRVAAGDYAITVTPPTGYAAPMSREGVTVASADIGDQDFTLARVGSVAGTVLDTGGAPVDGATIRIDGPSGARTTSTASDGTYRADDLPAGAYTLRVDPPAGYSGTGSLSTSITAAGEQRDGLDFSLARTQPSTGSGPTSPGGPSGPGSAPGSGAGSSPAGGGAATGGAGGAAGGAAGTGVADTGTRVASLLLETGLLIALGVGLTVLGRPRRLHHH